MFANIVQHGSVLNAGAVNLKSTTDSIDSWDTAIGEFVVSSGTHWRDAVEAAGLGKGSLWTSEMPAAAKIYVTDYNHSRRNGVDIVTISSRGCLTGFDANGIAKRHRTSYEGGIDTVTVEPAASAYVKSTGTIWAFTGTSWENTLQEGAPSAGMLSVSSPSGLSSTINAGSASASPGGCLRFHGPRLTFVDTYLANDVRFQPESDPGVAGGFGLLGLGTNAGSTSPALIGGVEPAPPDLPFVQTYSTPSQYNCALSSFGWVLVGRNAEPVAPGVTAVARMTDTFTFFNNLEFG